MSQFIIEKLGLAGLEKEQAPWIRLGIAELRKREDIELHVIAPFIKIRKNYSFTDGNVHYYCIKVGIPFTRRDWPRRFKINVWSGFYFFNVQVRNILKRVRPDLVNLQGAENAYYSSSVLGIKNYPVLVTVQGFVSLNNQDNTTHPYERKRLQVEKKILGNLKYFGVEATSMVKYIRFFNPGAKMFWFHFPFAKSNINTEVPREYDLVYFAKILKMKGIEDLIKAVAIARQQLPDISLCIIGKGDDDYLDYLLKMIRELGVTNNIIFRGFIPTQQIMHMEVIKSRISVLPTYNDTIPGTIVESMLLGVPVISYNTGGIPDLNRDEEHVILVEQGNITKLADAIIGLLRNTERQKEIAAKARKYASFEFDNARSADLMIRAYKDIIKEFKNEQ